MMQLLAIIIGIGTTLVLVRSPPRFERRRTLDERRQCHLAVWRSFALACSVSRVLPDRACLCARSCGARPRSGLGRWRAVGAARRPGAATGR